jgi:predicted DsbA family dithiol-disulfide isomerase
MKPTIKIDYVSDVACPWCAVGLGNLNQAIAQLSHKANFEIHFRPFELNPKMPLGGQDAIEHLTEKYGLTVEQVQANQANIISLFSENIKEKLASAMSIAKIFIDHTENTHTVDSINIVKLKIISCSLPFLFQESKTLKNKKYGSLTLLWKERPNLFI